MYIHMYVHAYMDYLTPCMTRHMNKRTHKQIIRQFHNETFDYLFNQFLHAFSDLFDQHDYISAGGLGDGATESCHVTKIMISLVKMNSLQHNATDKELLRSLILMVKYAEDLERQVGRAGFGKLCHVLALCCSYVYVYILICILHMHVCMICMLRSCMYVCMYV
jgi:hypothetical protein